MRNQRPGHLMFVRSLSGALAAFAMVPPLLSIGQSSTSASYHDWTLLESRDGIVSYRGDTKVDGAVPTKVELTIVAEPADVVAAITDFDGYKDWIPYCTSSEVLRTVNADECYAYYFISPPMVADRDVVVHSVTIRAINGSYEVVIADTQDMLKEGPEGVIRMPHFLSHYWISVDGSGVTHITHINETTLGGSIPEFLTSWSSHGQPLSTMQALKERILKHKTSALHQR